MTEKTNITEASVVEMSEVSEDSPETCARYESLITCIEKFIKKIRSKPGSCKKLAKVFPSLYKSNPEVVAVASNQLWDTFEENLRTDIMKLINNMQLRSLLCELTKCEASEDTQAWRPSGNPEKDSEAHIGLTQHNTILKLTELLQKEQSANAVLRDQVKVKESGVKKLLDEVEQQLEKIEETSSRCLQVEDFVSKLNERSCQESD
uniref:Polyamine-modulated factor 1-like n=1 Tax=Phallusia mammillata TaxID=59560 RepID=A0A6F9DPQ2_9ASCI|nr:polyamine-modulated factor 1-like [Phallusia mammillata]